MTMLQGTAARPTLFLLLLIGASLAGCSLLRQQEPTPAPAPPTMVTATQAAQAMQNDEFFSDFRGATLLVQGTVSTVEQQNGETMIRMTTGLPTGVVCDVGKLATAVKAGDAVTVKTQADDAQRATNSVLLRPCAVQ